LVNKLISFISPSRNIDTIKGFLDNIENTIHNPALVECVFKLDSDQPDAKLFIETEIKKRPFDIKYIITPRLNGLFSLWLAWNELFFLTSPDSYFIQPISDELRFKTQHWDDILKKYVGFFPDNVFRLRTSTFKLNTYPDPFICNLTPDSFPMCTRQWLNLTLGFGTYCWASDVYHQFIAYYLSLGEQGYQYYNTPFYDKGIFRDIPLLDVEFDGLEFGVGITDKMQRKRDEWTTHLWNKNLSHYEQENFCYLAKRVSSYIWAKQHGLNNFKLVKNDIYKTVQVIDSNNITHREVSYKLPRMKFFIMNIKRNYYFKISKYSAKPKRALIKLCHVTCKIINKVLDKLSPYQESKIIDQLLRLKLPIVIKQNLLQLKEYSQTLSVLEHGRFQKNIKLCYLFFYNLIQQSLTKIEKSTLSPAPGIPDERKFHWVLGEKKWPSSYHSISTNETKWALKKVHEQNDLMKEIENSVHG